MFDQDQELPDVIDRDAAGVGSMYLNKYFFLFYCDSYNMSLPYIILGKEFRDKFFTDDNFSAGT